MEIMELQDKANKIREMVVKMLVKAGSGHSAGPLGAADFFTCLYFGEVMKYKLKEPWWEERDRVVLSAGHYAPVLYAVLGEAGFFDKKELDSLRKIGSRLQGHPHRGILPGIENSSGPLGQGVSQAVGMAISGKMDKKDWRVFCFMSDGEQNEGQVWEAYMSVAKFGLDNLTLVVDRNNIQIDGYTQDVMPLEPFRAKLSAFGLEVWEIDGHDMEEILDTLKATKVTGRPSVVILKTTPGKGVGFMENLPEWHGKPPMKAGEAVEALDDIHKIRTLGGKIISEHE
jgi:transketolase